MKELIRERSIDVSIILTQTKVVEKRNEIERGVQTGRQTWEKSCKCMETAGPTRLPQE